MRQLGQSGIEISPIIMGTWQAGKSMWSGITDEDSLAALKAAYKAGVTTFDTAIVYGNGHSERLVGKAFKSVRDKVVLATKVFANQLGYQQVLNSCAQSLKNLQTDYIDLYQIHWPAGSFNSRQVPISETMQALNELKEAGKIRAIGVSNFSLEQLKEAQQYGQIDSLQPPYSLFWRHVEKDLQPYCAQQGISILAYSPLAQGLLTGKFKAGFELDPEDNRNYNKLFQGENFQRVQQALAQLEPIAQKYQVSLTNLALAWLISQPMTNAIVGARNAEQAKQNAQAQTLQPEAADIAAIDGIGRIVTDSLDSNDPITHDFTAARAATEKAKK
jgi:aryl-alcohol dehydrogenase-like predicted oxidoreductase